MLKLISCELQKLKRKKFIPFVILSAFLFPPPLALMMLTPRMMERYDTKAELFDDFYQFVLGYGVELLLPCVIGGTGQRHLQKPADHPGDQHPDDFR